MEKKLILITGSVLNADSNSVDTYNKLISMIDLERFVVYSPIDTMKFNGTASERYEMAMEMLSDTIMMIAEMSNVSTGQGMELQQAAILGIPVLVVAKENSKVSGLVKGCPAVKNIVYYSNICAIKEKIENFISKVTSGEYNAIKR